MSVPYVIEGSGQKEKVYDLYSRLLRDRIVFIGEDFTDRMANSIVGQLLFLESESPDEDITIYINSSGGYITAETAILDTMNYVKPDVSTVCVGHAASAGALILASGAAGKRYSLLNSRIMLHQISAGAQGHIKDMDIAIQETRILNDRMFEDLAVITGHSKTKLKKDMDRDFYMSAQEAKEYGVIDEVLTSRG